MIEALKSVWRALAVMFLAALPCASAATWEMGGQTRYRPPISFEKEEGVEASAAPQSGVKSRQPKGVRAPLVSNIEDDSLYSGCGCHFQLPSERRARSNRHFFKADMGTRAWMNIAGEDVELQIVGASHMSLKSRKGQRMDFRFRGAGGIRVRVRMLVTRTSTYEADYEPARYTVVVEAVKGERRQVITSKGETCGC